jgi:protein phosphatase
MILQAKPPLKIFGDIHGQFTDLMSFFALYGTPHENGKKKDIENFDYIFLGDFVDRGSHSLETICLLLSLKCIYPEQVHLIRGNHEDSQININFGFRDECAEKIEEDPESEDSVFTRINKLFDWLPLAALIEDKILCLHGGIGASLNTLEDIEKINRPLEVMH